MLRYGFRIAPGQLSAALACALLNSLVSVALLYLIGRVIGLGGRLVSGSAADLSVAGWLIGLLVAAFLVGSILPLVQDQLAAALRATAEVATEQARLEPFVRPRGIAHLDDAEVHNLHTTSAGVGWTSISFVLSAQVGSVGTHVTLLGTCVLIGSMYSWWLAAALVVATLLAETWIAHLRRIESGIVAGDSEGQRRAEYVFNLAMGRSAKELRVFGLADWLADRYARTWNATMRLVWNARRRSALISAAVFAGYALVLAFGLIFCVRAAFAGELALTQIGALVPAILAVPGVLFAAMAYDSGVGSGQIGRRALHALRELSAKAGSPVQPAGVRAPAGQTGIELELDNVSFRYPGQERDVLAGLFLRISSGERLALVGVNGAGKSTLVKLLTGGYQPTSGRVLVNGVDLATLSPAGLAAWQARIAAIVQDFVRLRDGSTVTENVLLDSLCDEPDLAATAERAGTADLVASLPHGWDTPLSAEFENGTDLSGGQWQRLALMRALAAVERGAGLLILDEPAAALDVRAEAALVERYLELTEGVTSLVISHRFSVVRPADRIVVLSGGRITESGTHAELIAARGEYATMFTLQAQRYADA